MTTKNENKQPSTLNSYKALAGEPVEWLSSSYGDARAIGFKGSEEAIKLCHNLISNFDCRPRDNWMLFPKAPSLQWLSPTLAYVYMTDARLLETLTLYFATAIMRNHETGSLTICEDPDDNHWTHDDAEVNRLAAETAQYFVDNNIKISSFLPDFDKSTPLEYALGTLSQNDSTEFESLVDAAQN